MARAMAIILNEREWAEDMIASRSLGKKPAETMRRVARYYLDDGVPKREVRKLMDKFLLQCDPTASLPRWADSLDYALSRAEKYESIHIDGIDITRPEMERIDALDGKQIRRLAFTLLCLAKYWNAVTHKPDGWVNTKDSEIMSLANINTSIKRQSLMYYNLNKVKMIQFSKKVDNTNVRVLFCKSGEVVMHITDFRNLGYQYMMYHGGPYFVCENCGITTKIESPNKGRKQRYCKCCAYELAIQRRVNQAMSSNKDDRLYTVYMHEFPDGRVYIGSTSQNLSRRWKNGMGYRSEKVGEAINEFGWENINHYILFKGLDRNTALSIESYMIRKKKSYLPQYGFNVKDKTSCFLIDDCCEPQFIMQKVDGGGLPIP